MNSKFDSLRFTITCLASPHSKEVRESVAREIRSDRVNWGEVCEVASAHLVTPSLHSALANTGLLRELPPDLQNYLATIKQLNHERNLSILSEAHRTIAVLNGVGIEPVLLKGISHLVTGLYEDVGDRVVADIDLLVHESSLDLAWTNLRNANYQTLDEFSDAPANWSSHHAPPLFRKGGGIRVEVHHCLSRVEGWPAFLSGEALHQQSRKMTRGGLRFRDLSAQHKVAYNMFHEVVQYGRGSSGLPSLRQLCDLDLLSRKETGIDWSRIEQVCQSSCDQEACNQYVATCLSSFPGSKILWSTPSIGEDRTLLADFLSRHSGLNALYLSLFLINRNFRLFLREVDPGPWQLVNAVRERICSPAWWQRRWEHLQVRIKQGSVT